MLATYREIILAFAALIEPLSPEAMQIADIVARLGIINARTLHNYFSERDRASTISGRLLIATVETALEGG